MTFILEAFTEAEGWSTVDKPFKTLRGATTAGCVRLKAYGYLHADHFEGYGRRHIVAEWKNDRGVVVQRVWK